MIVIRHNIFIVHAAEQILILWLYISRVKDKNTFSVVPSVMSTILFLTVASFKTKLKRLRYWPDPTKTFTPVTEGNAQ